MSVRTTTFLVIVSAILSFTFAQYPANPQALSIHAIDTDLRLHIANLTCRSYKQDQNVTDIFRFIVSNVTDVNGRIDNLVPVAGFEAGIYRVWCDSAEYFARQNRSTLYPVMQTTFYINDQRKDQHVVFLMTAHGFNTYRGV